MKRVKIKNSILFVFLVSGFGLLYVSCNKVEKEADNKVKVEKEKVIDYFPDKINFEGEQAPLKIEDVKERFDRELIVNKNYHSYTILALKRANKSFPIIEPILKKNGVPDDFKYLAVIESGLVNVVSKAGARGVWQFMPETAKGMGLEVNNNVDERYHLAKSTQAACDFILNAKDKFGSWTLAAASYNRGLVGVQKLLKFQQESSYYDLYMNEETGRYVFRIMALKEIMKDPAKFGFQVDAKDKYKLITTKKVVVTNSIDNLVAFAKAQGINYKTLKIYNPWLRSVRLLNPTHKRYVIEIPLSGL
ncbi:MAG: membrane-bound lytic murein transglycosylase D [Flavobacteriales bacterium]|jgi:membrane-bound lytic murein transglycosylase D